MILELLNKPMPEDQWFYFTEHHDASGNNDRFLRALPHSIGCKCGSRREYIHREHAKGRTFVDLAAELGISNSRVQQLYNRVIRCKRFAWRPHAYMTDDLSVAYLHEIASMLVDAIEKPRKSV